jgi:hypothetical protein
MLDAWHRLYKTGDAAWFFRMQELATKPGQ